MLVEIKDPVRLKAGDLMVIPSEANTGKKRKLHLSPASYGDWGLSIGFTGRSENTVKGVRSLLAEDGGKPTVLYVYDTTERFCRTDREERYGDLLGGCRTMPKNDVPEVRRAYFLRLPTPDDGSLADARYWIEHFGERVAKVLSGHLLFRHAAERYPTSAEDRRDQALKDAVESLASAGDGCGRQALPDLVPTCDVGARADEAMPWETIEDILSHGLFATPYSVSKKDNSLAAGPKFLLTAAKRGVRFYRPDDAFLDAVSRHTAEVVMLEYAKRQTEVLRRVRNFVKRLGSDLGNARWRGRSACAIVRKLQLRKPEVRKLFKELM